MKKFLIRLNLSYVFTNLNNHYHFLLIGVIILLMAYHFQNVWYIIVLIGYLIVLFHGAKFLGMLLTLLLLGITMNILLRHFSFTKLPLGYYEGKATVIKVDKKDNYQQILLQLKHAKVLWKCKQPIILQCGMKLSIKGTIEAVSKAHTPNGFDYQQYLQYLGIKGNLNDVEILSSNNTWSVYKIPEMLSHFYDTHFSNPSKGFLKALVIGNKVDLPDEFMDNLAKVGIGHLFVVSGLHIGILLVGFEKLFRRLQTHPKMYFILQISFLLGYYIATHFLISVLRVLLNFFLTKLANQFHWQWTKLDICSISALFVLLIQPFRGFSYAFILSYTVTISIILVQTLLFSQSNIKYQIANTIIISTIGLGMTLPIVNRIQADIPILSILYNVVYIPFVTYMLLPFSIITSFLPFLDSVYGFSIKIFCYITTFFAKTSVLHLTVPVLSPVMILVYYFVLWLLLRAFEQKKQRVFYSLLFIVVIFICCHAADTRIDDKITFLDLPQGEATLIQGSFGKVNILIDTGEAGNDELRQFLKKNGIRKLHALIITHSDSDHCGLTEMLITEFKVNDLFVSFLEVAWINELKAKHPSLPKLHFLKRGDTFSYPKCIFRVLSPEQNNGSKNNNSLVLYASLFNTTILFTGDMEQKVEQELIQKEGKLQVDLLKIGHHGSITSSSSAFLEKMDYQVAIIMNGYYNTFGFPHPVVLERLKKRPCYVTGESGSIILSKGCWQKSFRIAKTK